MKILLATDTYAPETNGPARLVKRLADDLSVEHDVHVVHPSTGRRISVDCATEGVTEHRLSLVPTPRDSQPRLSLLPGLKGQAKSLVERVGPDVVHVHSQLPLGRALTAAARELGLPVVATCSVTPDKLSDQPTASSPLRRRLSGWAWQDAVRTLNQAGAVTAPTSYAAALLTSAGVREPVLTVSSGVDLTHFHPAADGGRFRRTHNLTASPTLVCVGQLVPDKHIDELIEATAALRARWDVQLVVIGEGPDRAQLEALAAIRGVSASVTFTGAVSDADLAGAYAAADVFCIAGTGELQSMVTLEAMASGLPVVAVDAAALRHLVHHGDNGLLYRRGYVPQLASHIWGLLDDPDSARRMGQRSRALATQHDATVTRAAFLRLYGGRQPGLIQAARRPPAMMAVDR